MTEAKNYPGARTLVELHEIQLRSFLATWRLAKAADLELPRTEDRAYRTQETLLRHVLECAGRYITWAADKLGIDPPILPDLPDEDEIEAEADRVLEAILEAWRLPLADQPLEAFVTTEHEAWWGTRYCVDAMLEHAVMHPLRHDWQLKQLAGRSGHVVDRPSG